MEAAGTVLLPDVHGQTIPMGIVQGGTNTHGQTIHLRAVIARVRAADIAGTTIGAGLRNRIGAMRAGRGLAGGTPEPESGITIPGTTAVPGVRIRTADGAMSAPPVVAAPTAVPGRTDGTGTTGRVVTPGAMTRRGTATTRRAAATRGMTIKGAGRIDVTARVRTGTALPIGRTAGGATARPPVMARGGVTSGRRNAGIPAGTTAPRIGRTRIRLWAVLPGTGRPDPDRCGRSPRPWSRHGYRRSLVPRP